MTGGSGEPTVTGMIEVDPGVSLWYRIVGDGHETVLVPTNGNHTEFDDLNVPDHRIVFYDLRGRGRSDPVDDVGRLGFTETVEDIECVREALGIDHFSALGWSWVAAAFVEYALGHHGRVERLVMVSSVPCHAGVVPARVRPPEPHRLAALDQVDAAGLREEDPVAYCRAWRAVYVPPLLGDPDGFARMADVAALPNEWPWHVARSLVPIYADLMAYDWRGRLWPIDAPTLVVHGALDQDPVATAQEWVDALPGGRLAQIGNVGPVPWVERPTVFFDYVNRFLAGDL